MFEFGQAIEFQLSGRARKEAAVVFGFVSIHSLTLIDYMRLPVESSSLYVRPSFTATQRVISMRRNFSMNTQGAPRSSAGGRFAKCPALLDKQDLL